MDVPAELIVRIRRRDRASVGFRCGRLPAVAALLCRGVGSVISPGTATQRRGYNISEAMVRVASCCCSRLALSRRDLLSRLARRHSAVATTSAKRWLV